MQKTGNKIVGLQKYIPVLVILILAVSGITSIIQAQGMVNISVTGIPAVIDAPFTDQFEQNFRNGRYQLIFTYNDNTFEPKDFRFRFRLTRGGREMIEVVSEPKSFQPGAYVFTSIFDELPFRQSFEEVIAQVESKIRRQVVQEGTIPEGNYLLHIEAVPEQGSGTIASTRSVTPFTVRYPQPPILINPTDESNLTLETPVFNWTPVVGIPGSPIHYDFLLVEVMNNQTPLQAINSNRALAERSIIDQSTLIYTPEFLPLEEGRQYAWQVSVSSSEQALPIRNGGKSVVHTFVYKEGASEAEIADIRNLENIPLVPDFANLVNLDRLEIDQEGNNLILNGVADLELQFDQTYTIPVDIHNLSMMSNNLQDPLLVSGEVAASSPGNVEQQLQAGSSMVNFNSIVWNPASGLRVNGNLILPDGSIVPSEDWLQLTPEGLQGKLTAHNTNGVLNLGGDPVEISLTDLEANFPEMQMFARGELNLFSNEVNCSITQFNLLDDSTVPVFSCGTENMDIPLIQDSNHLRLSMNQLKGTLDYNFENEDFTYELNTEARLIAGLSSDNACSTSMQVDFSSDGGVNVSQLTSNCGIYANPLDLGFMKMKPNKVSLNNLNYLQKGEWDFDFDLEGTLLIPALDNWMLPVTQVGLNNNGLEFPDIDWNARQLGISDPLEIESYRISPLRFAMSSFIFPWGNRTKEDIDKDEPGEWNFTIDFDLEFGQDGSENMLPECVSARTLTVNNAGFTDGILKADIPATVLRNCRMDIAQGYTFTIHELGGELTATATAEKLDLDTELVIDAELETGSPFKCAGDGSSAKGSLTINEEGFLDGSINNVVTGCPIEFGPFTAVADQSSLLFSEGGEGNQQLIIDTEATLNLNNSQSVNGTFIYDVLNREIIEIDFSTEQPFVLNLPSKSQRKLSFLIEGMQLTDDGILIDGRHRFLLGDDTEVENFANQLEQQVGQSYSQGQVPVDVTIPEEIGTIDVTFDQLLFSMQDYSIQSGKIIFDESFAIQAAVSSQEPDIDFSVKETGEYTLSQNSLYAELGGQVIIDSSGLHSSGQAEAKLKVGELNMGSMTVEFSQDFSMGFEPFGVQQGQADLLYQSRRVAYVDNSGFHPDPAYLAGAIPDTLDLPTRDAAYIVLRNSQDDLLLDAQAQGDGTYSLSTTAPLDLVIPALQGNSLLPPTTKVSFTDVVYDPGSQDITAGTIEGDFEPDIDLTDMNIPFKLKKVRYDEDFVAHTNSSERGLFLEGDIVLYEHDMGQNGEAVLYLENGNRLRGDIDLQNLNADIPLVPQSQLSVLSIDSLGGTVNIPLDDLEIPDVSLDMRGEFLLQKEDQSAMARLSVRSSYQNGNFIVSALQQPSQTPERNPLMIGDHTGFRIDRINTFSVNYRSHQNDFDFIAELDFSLLMNLADGDSIEVPLKAVELTENGFVIPQQTLNKSSNPPLITPSFELGSSELSILEFRTLQPISFNWFSGEGIPPAFEMDLDLKLAALADSAPQAAQASITLNSVGFNQGIITGQVEPYTFQGNGVPVELGANTSFMLTSVQGGLTNDGTSEEPVQGYDIGLTGSLDYPSFFVNKTAGCNEPELTVNLSRDGGLVGTITNITPCGELVYGPATLAFDPSSSIEFAFNDDEQSLVLDGDVTAEIDQENATDITATGSVNVDVISGSFNSGSILVNDLFTYSYPQVDPLFKFRVQQARLDQNGVVFTGDAGLTFPNSQDTAKVTFTNFTIHPQDEGIASGSLMIQDSLAFEVGVSPIDWSLVDPSSTFDSDNAARMLTVAGVTLDENGMSLTGNATASARVGGEPYPDLNLDYSGLTLNFSPTRVTAGRADFTIRGDNSPFGYLDKDGFDLDIPGLVTSVIPDTLLLPDKSTAFLILGDKSGDRYELVDDEDPRRIRTMADKTVDLVIPGFTNGNNDTLKAQVEFNLQIDQFFNVQSGSVTLQNNIDLDPFTQLPISIIELSYDGNTKELSAATEVNLPQSLNNINMVSSVVIDDNGFKQGSITAGEYRTTYLPDQETVTPIAADTLGQDALYFYVRGFEMEFGQNNNVAFSGQLKSDFLKDSEDNMSPLHFAASYVQGDWDFNIDASHLTQNGIDMGYAKIDPIQDPQNQYLEMFDIILNDNEFGVRFAGVVTLPDIAGEDFAVTVEQMKISSNSPYFTVAAQTGLPDQEFTLFGDVMTFNTSNTTAFIDNSVFGIELDGSFDFYTEQDISFEDLVFRSDGTVDIQGGLSSNLLSEDIVVLEDEALVLKELRLALQNSKLEMTASGSAKLPAPLTAESTVSISADTEGNVDVTGPNFIFDEEYSIDEDPTEFAIGSFATLELTGLGLDIDLKAPDNTALFAAGVIFVENNVDKRIMFGDAGNLQQDPGIMYSLDQGVEWNVKSNFDPNSSPLNFEYEFFNINIASIQVQNNVDIGGGQTLPFQVEIGGKTGLSIAGVSGEVDFSGFKFSTKGVDNIGKIDGGGTFTLMDIVSLELGEFDYESAPEGQTMILKFAEGQTNEADPDQGPSVDSTEVNVRKFLHFQEGPSGQALNISLSEGITGGIDEVLYYEGADGELNLRIKNANLSLTDQAELAVGMEFITAGDNGSGFSLMVAGGGKFSSTGLAAAGKISTLNNQLSFGILVAAKASVNILGIVEASSLGGGFFFRPEVKDLNLAIDAVKAMDEQFQLNGPQPDVENMNLALLLYAGISIGGVGDNAAISGNALIQVTDQFTKLDANGVIFNQKDKLEAGMYLTLIYTEQLAGVEGGLNIVVDYSPVMDGGSEVDFFASKHLDQPEVLWGITGNIDLDVLSILELDGSFIASSDGMLLDMGLSGGFDLAIISGKSSFELLAWYLPAHTDPMGIYSEFSVKFSILMGMAEFGGSVEGGLFDRGSYHMLYFAGEAYVDVAGVYEGNISGWVKLRTKSPAIDYGTGPNREFETMIAQAKSRADTTKEKAEKTRDNLEDAKNELDAAKFVRSDETLGKAGYDLLLSDNYQWNSLVNNVVQAEEALHGSVPSVIEWISENVMQGNKKRVGTFTSYSEFREKPRNTASEPEPEYVSDPAQYSALLNTVDYAINAVKDEAPPVQNRIDDAIVEMSGLAEEMKLSLASEGALSLENPVTNIQDAMTTGNGGLISAPSFQVDTVLVDANKNSLENYEQELFAADQRYREAIVAAATNIELIDLVVEGEAAINWGTDTEVQLPPDNAVSVNDVALTYMRAVHKLREKNAQVVGYYWSMQDWAGTRYNLLTQHSQEIKSFARDTLWMYNDSEVSHAADVAAARENALASFEGSPTTASSTSEIHQLVMDNDEVSRSVYKETGTDFWYEMPRLGLEEVRDEFGGIADSLAGEFNQKLTQLNTAHKSFTESVDQLYRIKTDMLTTVYGMIEEYNAWSQEAFSDSEEIAEAPFTNRIQEIEQALAPPTIDFLKGESGEGEISSSSWAGGYRDFYGNAILDYQASHPMGVPEISFSITDGTIGSVYNTGDFYTGGIGLFDDATNTGRRFMFSYPKESVNQTSRDLTGMIRARSIGGTTVSRFVNFSIPVSMGGVGSDMTVNLGDDHTPPSKPIIEHSYPSFNNTYFTADSALLNFTVKSADNESDVALFQYKIGTSIGADDIRGWTDLQGTRGTGQGMTMGTIDIFGTTHYTSVLSSMSKMEATIRGMSMENNKPYYLSFKTINGDGVESSEKQISFPFVFDATPPEDVTVTITPDLSSLQRQQAITQPVFRQPIMVAPDWRSNKINQDYSSVAGQEFTISWSSNDPESDVEGFIITDADGPGVPMSETLISEAYDFNPIGLGTEISYTPPFDSDRYMYFQARNHVGMISNDEVIGPIQSIDITPPTTPDARVMGAYDGFKVYFTQLSDDNQTGVKGYQYTVLDSTGTTVLRPWPDSASVDFNISSSYTGSSKPAGKYIRANFLQESGHYQVGIRAINQQNMPSRPVINRNVTFDSTPPEKPLARISYTKQKEFEIIFDHLRDHESGIKEVKYILFSGDYLQNQALNLERTGLENLSEILSEGIIEKPSAGKPRIIKVGNTYFQKHPYPYKPVDKNNQVKLQAAIIAVNGMGQQTINTIPIVIPYKSRADYLNILEQVHQSLPGGKQPIRQLSLPKGK